MIRRRGSKPEHGRLPPAPKRTKGEAGCRPRRKRPASRWERGRRPRPGAERAAWPSPGRDSLLRLHVSLPPRRRCRRRCCCCRHRRSSPQGTTQTTPWRAATPGLALHRQPIGLVLPEALLALSIPAVPSRRAMAAARAPLLATTSLERREGLPPAKSTAIGHLGRAGVRRSTRGGEARRTTRRRQPCRGGERLVARPRRPPLARRKTSRRTLGGKS